MERRHRKGARDFKPETLALGYGYDPFKSEGSVKPPVFLTSTFQFHSAAEGKRFFELAYGLRQPEEHEEPGLIYSRLNNPNLQIFEERLAAWDRTDKGAVFASGMAAISTTMLALLKPGDHVLSSAPVYGGTHFLFEHVLPRFGIQVIQVPAGNDTPVLMREAAEQIGEGKVKFIFIETPANPSNALVDIQRVAEIARELSARSGSKIITAVDNTFLGPVFQRPAPLGADLVIYSATKFIGGHSDLIAGVVTGPAELIDILVGMRTILGTVATPFSGWLLLRSLETLSVRMRRQAKSAQRLAELLAAHPAVKHVHYPGLLHEDDPQHQIYRRQCTGPGSLIAFEVDGDALAAARVLDGFEVARLAVSLGGTETLVEHPASMTHSDVPPERLAKMGVSQALIRMSVGLEHLTDLKHDVLEALERLRDVGERRA
jgi:methionine-gamma-lyase